MEGASELGKGRFSSVGITSGTSRQGLCVPALKTALKGGETTNASLTCTGRGGEMGFKGKNGLLQQVTGCGE